MYGNIFCFSRNTQAKPAEDAVYAKVSREKPNSKVRHRSFIPYVKLQYTIAVFTCGWLQ